MDNSQNHLKMADDALRASKLNLGDGGKNTPLLRNGWFVNQSGERVEQVMQREDGVQKGLRTILLERGLWPSKGLSLSMARGAARFPCTAWAVVRHPSGSQSTCVDASEVSLRVQFHRERLVPHEVVLATQLYVFL